VLARTGRHPAAPIPVRSGIGLRAPHYRDILEQRPAVGWLETHSENYFGAGGAPLHYLDALRVDYPLSLHGVGLSLGSADELNKTHVKKLRNLIDAFEPGLVSEHLSWSSIDGTYFNDLLPLPHTDEALCHLAARIALAQDLLGRQLLIENPSNYLSFRESVGVQSAIRCARLSVRDSRAGRAGDSSRRPCRKRYRFEHPDIHRRSWRPGVRRRVAIVRILPAPNRAATHAD
jgi:hypothetical protein